MSDVEFVNYISKELESLLKDYYGAEGTGLGQKFRSVQHEFNEAFTKKLSWIIYERNKLAHDKGYDEVPEQANFRLACEEALAELEQCTVGRKNVYTGEVYTTPHNYARDVNFNLAMQRYEKYGVPRHVLAMIYAAAFGIPYYLFNNIVEIAIGTIVMIFIISIVNRIRFSFRLCFISGAIGFSAIIHFVSGFLVSSILGYGYMTYYFPMILSGTFMAYCFYILIKGGYKYFA